MAQLSGLLIVLLSIQAGHAVAGEPVEDRSAAIINGTDWKDPAANPIVAHEGEIARFGDVFYWYGSSYANNP